MSVQPSTGLCGVIIESPANYVLVYLFPAPAAPELFSLSATREAASSVTSEPLLNPSVSARCRHHSSSLLPTTTTIIRVFFVGPPLHCLCRPPPLPFPLRSLRSTTFIIVPLCSTLRIPSLHTSLTPPRNRDKIPGRSFSQTTTMDGRTG